MSLTSVEFKAIQNNTIGRYPKVWYLVSPCAFQVILLGLLLSPLSWLEILQDEGVRLSAPLRQNAQELREKHDDL